MASPDSSRPPTGQRLSPDSQPLHHTTTKRGSGAGPPSPGLNISAPTSPLSRGSLTPSPAPAAAANPPTWAASQLAPGALRPSTSTWAPRTPVHYSHKDRAGLRDSMQSTPQGASQQSPSPTFPRLGGSGSLASSGTTSPRSAAAPGGETTPSARPGTAAAGPTATAGAAAMAASPMLIGHARPSTAPVPHMGHVMATVSAGGGVGEWAGGALHEGVEEEVGSPEGESTMKGACISLGIRAGPDLSDAARPERIMAALNLPAAPLAPMSAIRQEALADHAAVNSDINESTTMRDSSLTGASPFSRLGERKSASAAVATHFGRSSLQREQEDYQQQQGKQKGKQGVRGQQQRPADSLFGRAQHAAQLHASLSTRQSGLTGNKSGMMGGRPNSVQPVQGVFVDLLEATRKTFAAGMGEWDLQALDWGNPTFKQRLLQGPIGPESLKSHYGLLEPDVLRLYRVLYLYSVGFCAAVLEPTERARDREQLLEAVFKAYAQLWDEALGISFQSEIVDVLRTKTDAVSAMNDMTAEMATVRGEHAELQQRLNQFVRGNIDNMLAFRMVKDGAASAEGQAAMLAATNDALSVKLAGAELAREELGMAATTAASKQATAEEHATKLEGTLSRAKAALKEQSQLSAKHAKAVKELETALAESRKETKAVDAQKQHVSQSLADLSGSIQGLRTEAAEKSRAYTILHANWVVKEQELNTLRAELEVLRSKVAEMHDTHATATQQIQEAREAEHGFRSKWELTCQQVNQLTETNKTLAARNGELVKSYWPLVARLREADAACVTAQAVAEEAHSKWEAQQQEVSTLRKRVEGAAQDRIRMEALEKELALDSQELPESVLTGLSPEVAVRVRAFFRGAKQRVAELTQQLVRLVDVQASSAHDLRQSQLARKELTRKLAMQEVAMQDQQEDFSRKLARATVRGAAAGRGSGSGSGGGAQGGYDLNAASSEAAGIIAGLKVDLQDLRADLVTATTKAVAAEENAGRLQDHLDAITAGSTSKDRWMSEAASQAARLSSQVEMLLLQDPSAPHGMQLPSVAAVSAALQSPRLREIDAYQRTGQRPPSAGTAAGTAAAAAGADASGAQAGTDQAGADGEEAAAASDAGKGSAAGTPRPGSAGTDAAAGTGAQRPAGVPPLARLPVAGAPRASVATGRIACALKVAGETRGAMVDLDSSWEELTGSLDRLLAWGASLIEKKLQLTEVGQLQEQAASCRQRAERAEAALTIAQQAMQEAEGRFVSSDRRVAEAASAAAASERRSKASAALEAAASADAQAVRSELGELHSKHVLMEEEYWAIKAQLLESQLRESSLTAARDRALVDASRANDIVVRAEREAAEHRTQRQQLESDVVGLKAWVRTMQSLEVAYRELVVDHGRTQQELDAARTATESLQQQLTKLSGAQGAPATTISAEVAAAHTAADAAAEVARAAELARSEMQSLLAEARRAAEASEDALRHARADAGMHATRAQQAAHDLVRERQRGDRLAGELLGARLEVKQRQAERGMALGALVDARTAGAAAAAVGAAAEAGAVEADVAAGFA